MKFPAQSTLQAALLLAAAPMAWAQDPGSGATPVSAASGAPSASTANRGLEGDKEAASAEALRARIKKMRMNLLLGGDQVRQAESQAVDFYSSKTRSVESRMDDVATELVEVRASYDVVLDRALTSGAGDALKEAQPLRSRISSLEAEAKDLEKRRERLSELVASVEERDRDRRRLVDQIESASALPDSFGAPMMSIGLAPPPLASEASAPLDDDALFMDLMERDPRRAKELYFQADPVRYWRRFPLTPPAAPLQEAMGFPLPDPVGRR